MEPFWGCRKFSLSTMLDSLDLLLLLLLLVCGLGGLLKGPLPELLSLCSSSDLVPLDLGVGVTFFKL